MKVKYHRREKYHRARDETKQFLFVLLPNSASPLAAVHFYPLLPQPWLSLRLQSRSSWWDTACMRPWASSPLCCWPHPQLQHPQQAAHPTPWVTAALCRPAAFSFSTHRFGHGVPLPVRVFLDNTWGRLPRALNHHFWGENQSDLGETAKHTQPSEFSVLPGLQ